MYSTGCRATFECDGADSLIQFNGAKIGGKTKGMNIVIISYPGDLFLSFLIHMKKHKIDLSFTVHCITLKHTCLTLFVEFEFRYAKTYNTGEDPNESEKMVKFLSEVRDSSIILLVSNGDATSDMTDEAWNALVSYQKNVNKDNILTIFLHTEELICCVSLLYCNLKVQTDN